MSATRFDPAPRCCWLCYHYAFFQGYDGLTCELTHKPKKVPWRFNPCRHFAYVDTITGRPVTPREASEMYRSRHPAKEVSHARE